MWPSTRTVSSWDQLNETLCFGFLFPKRGLSLNASVKMWFCTSTVVTLRLAEWNTLVMISFTWMTTLHINGDHCAVSSMKQAPNVLPERWHYILAVITLKLAEWNKLFRMSFSWMMTLHISSRSPRRLLYGTSCSWCWFTWKMTLHISSNHFKRRCVE